MFYYLTGVIFFKQVKTENQDKYFVYFCYIIKAKLSQTGNTNMIENYKY